MMILCKMHVCCFDRLNIDPDNVYSDLEVWESLEKVNLRECIENLPHQLDSQVDRDGDKLSVGERQLLSLARAWLKDVKVTLLLI
jgi:ABC-type transport system involved in cytochrome bd biosynthesis, fused ATPase and permease components